MNQSILIHVTEELALLCSVWNQSPESLIKQLTDHATPEMLKEVNFANCWRPDGSLNVRAIGRKLKKQEEHNEKFEYDPAYLATAICVSAYGHGDGEVSHHWPPYDRPPESSSLAEP